MSNQATRAEVVAVAVAESFRGDGEILANPIGNIPMIGGRLAKATFEPLLLMTDGEATLIENIMPVGVANPREPGTVQMAAHLVHLHPRMPIVHVVDVERGFARFADFASDFGKPIDVPEFRRRVAIDDDGVRIEIGDGCRLAAALDVLTRRVDVIVDVE